LRRGEGPHRVEAQVAGDAVDGQAVRTHRREVAPHQEGDLGDLGEAGTVVAADGAGADDGDAGGGGHVVWSYGEGGMESTVGSDRGHGKCRLYKKNGIVESTKSFHRGHHCRT